MKISQLVVASLICVSACSSHPKKAESPTPEHPVVQIDPTQPVELRLKGKTGDVAKTYYHSDSAVEEFEDGQKVRDHEELMDFTVGTQVKEANLNQMVVTTKTLFKDGTSSLHDFAFPEPDEAIDFIYTRDAQVLRADPFPKESIFFLPPISLPTNDVKVGDTWTMDHAWISAGDGLPLNLDMVTIFKAIVPCGVFGRCADLEVSGRVDVISPKLQEMAHFDSHMWGRMLFSIDTGDVIWSEVRSNEDFRTAHNEMHVLSCMVSIMGAPDGSKAFAPKCKPNQKAVAVPSI